MNPARLDLVTNEDQTLGIVQGSVYEIEFVIRQQKADTWEVTVLASGNDGDTFDLTIFDSTIGDQPSLQTAVQHIKAAGETPTDVATALASLLTAAIAANPLLSAVSVTDLLNGTIRLVDNDLFPDGDNSGRYLAVVVAASGAGSISATNTDTSLDDISADTFSTDVRCSANDPTVLASWRQGTEYFIDDGPLGHLRLTLPNALTATYTWEIGVWSLRRDKGSTDTDVETPLEGDVQNTLVPTLTS